MRARNLKPGIFKNEVLGVADSFYTVVFCGLWCCADREGRLEDRPLRIHAEVAPYKNSADTVLALQWLEQAGFIVRYEVDGARYIQVVNFRKHQQPHIKEAQSRIPPPQNQLLADAESKHGASTVQAPDKHGCSPSDSGLLTPDSGLPRGARKRATRLPEDWTPSETERAYAKGKGLDVDVTAEKFRNYWLAKSGGATKLDWTRTWQNWCIEEAQRRPARLQTPPPKPVPTAEQIAAERKRAIEDNQRELAAKLKLGDVLQRVPK